MSQLFSYMRSEPLADLELVSIVFMISNNNTATDRQHWHLLIFVNSIIWHPSELLQYFMLIQLWGGHWRDTGLPVIRFLSLWDTYCCVYEWWLNRQGLLWQEDLPTVLTVSHLCLHLKTQRGGKSHQLRSSCRNVQAWNEALHHCCWS